MSQKDIYSKYSNQIADEQQEEDDEENQDSSYQQSPEKDLRESLEGEDLHEDQGVIGEDDEEQEESDDEEDEEEEENNQGQQNNSESNSYYNKINDKNYQTDVTDDQNEFIEENDQSQMNPNKKQELKYQLDNQKNLYGNSVQDINEKPKQYEKPIEKNENIQVADRKTVEINENMKEPEESVSKRAVENNQQLNIQQNSSNEYCEVIQKNQSNNIVDQKDNIETIKDVNCEDQQQKSEIDNKQSDAASTQEESKQIELVETPIVKEKKIELRPKVIYDPKHDVDQYPGSYSDSGESDDEANNEDDEEEDDDDSENESRSRKSKAQQLLKKKNNKKEQAKKPQVKKVYKKQTLVLNVADTKYPVVKFVGKKIFKWKLAYDMESMDFDIFWTDNAVQPEQLGRMQPYQKINHFPGMFSLARKNHLARNLMKMRKQFPDQYKFFPQTWLLPAEYNEFRNQFEKSRAQQKIFIVKPEASCQGRGIFLTRSLDDLNPSDHYVVQRYLNKPYLIDGLKFDFRLYVLLAGCDPLRIYLYYEGLTRFATEKYQEVNRDNIEDMCMHLTNYAINKDNPNFKFNQDKEKMDVGHKRSLTSVLQLLEDQGHDINRLWKDIKRVLIKTIISAQPTLAHHYRSCQPDNFMNNMCFEILGFDIILDSHLKPWVLEVNHTPSFSTDTPLDSYIKKNTIRDSLKLMNCTCKAKNETINQRKEIMQKRVLTGKKVKYTPEEKLEEIKKAQQKRDEYEDKHLGGFERIFPMEDDEDDKFTEFIQYALKCYEEQTGANIRRNTKKVTEDPKKITNLPKKLNQPKDLEKIYNTKIGAKLPPRKPNSQATINKGIPGQNGQRPSSSQLNEEGETIQCEDQEQNKDEAIENAITRSASGRMHGFRIKKQNSPYNIHQKFKNRIQNRVAIGVKELKLAEEPFQFEENTNGKPSNPNVKKIQAYITSEKEQLEIKNMNILQDQNYNSSRAVQAKKQQIEPQALFVQEPPTKRLQILNQTKPPQQKLQFQVIDNTAAQMEEERRQWLIQAQRNLQYQLSQQQYQPQQKLALLPKGPPIHPQTNVLQSLVDIPNISNSKEILATVGGAISGQYKTDKRVAYKQKGQIQNQSINQVKDNNGLFLQPKLFEIQNFQSSQQLQTQQTIQSSLDQNLIGINKNMIGLNDLFVSGKSHKVQPHYQAQQEPYGYQKHNSYSNYNQK
ncbi:hypothetical protein ABPG72_006927 [Tetrahymena utriculariae]